MNTPKIHCLHDEVLEIGSDRLKPHPENPNEHDDAQLDVLGDIIGANGWRRPIRISKLSGLMTVGHGALAAAVKKGWTHVPVNYQEYSSAQEEYADMVADNAIGAWSEMNREKILRKLPELQGMDVRFLGLKDFKLPDITAPQERQEDGSVFDRTHQQYTGSIIKQIVLFFKAEDYTEIVRRLNELLERTKEEGYSQLIVRLMNEYDRVNPPASGPEAAHQEVSPTQ